MRHYTKTQGSQTLLKSIDANNNYSLSSSSDPEPSGYVDHRWGADPAEWTEISEDEAERLQEKFYEGGI